MAGKSAKSASRARSASKGAAKPVKKASGVTKRIAKPRAAVKPHHHVSASKPVVVNDLALGNITSQAAGHHVAAKSAGKARSAAPKRVAHHKKSATKKAVTKRAVAHKGKTHKAKSGPAKRVAKKVGKK